MLNIFLLSFQKCQRRDEVGNPLDAGADSSGQRNSLALLELRGWQMDHSNDAAIAFVQSIGVAWRADAHDKELQDL